MKFLTLSKRITPVLVLALLTTTVPLTFADAPVEREWSPYELKAPIRDLALADEGEAFATATDVPEERAGGDGTVPPITAPSPEASGTAFNVFDHHAGLIFNGTKGDDREVGTSAMRVAAASADGRWVYGGDDRAVHYYAFPGIQRQGNATDPTYRAPVDGPVVDLDATRSGDWVIAAVESGEGEGQVVLLDAVGGVKRTYPTSSDGPVGPITTVDASLDGGVLIAGGRASGDANDTRGAVYLLTPSRGLVKAFTLSNATWGPVIEVAVSDDGAHFVALTNGGVLLAFNQAGADTREPAPIQLPGSLGSAIALSGDGNVLALAGGDQLAVLERTASGVLAAAWNGTAPGPVHDLDASRDGQVIVAATDAGAAAYSPFGSTYHWLVSGKTTQAEVNANGTYAVFAQGRDVVVRQLQESVAFALVDENGDEIATENVTARSVAPFQTVVYDAIVHNDGSRLSHYRVQVEDIHGATVAAEPSAFDLAPGETRAVELHVTPGRLDPGSYAVEARALVGDTEANLSLPFEVTPHVGIDARLTGSEDRHITQKANDSILVSIRNTGNEAVDVRVDVDQDPSEGPDWNVHVLGNREFTLPPGASVSTTVHVRVEPPDRVENGTSNEITITVTGGNATLTETVTYRVNPTASVKVDSERRTKLINPGSFARFNLTVRNTGSVPALFGAIWDPIPNKTSSEGAWVVMLGDASFRLEPDATRVVPVRIYAPESAMPDDHAGFRITVRSIAIDAGNSEASASVNLTAKVIERKDASRAQGDGTNVIPAPGAALVLAGLLAVGLAQRRRRP